MLFNKFYLFLLCRKTNSSSYASNGAMNDLLPFITEVTIFGQGIDGLYGFIKTKGKKRCEWWGEEVVAVVKIKVCLRNGSREVIGIWMILCIMHIHLAKWTLGLKRHTLTKQTFGQIQW